MIYLILSILANVLFFISFRAYKKFKIDTLQAIVVNYYVCVLMGLIYQGDFYILKNVDFSEAWSWMGIFLGLQLIPGFYLMAITSQRLGVSVASIANKMSMVLPILFSLFVLHFYTRDLRVINYIGIILAPVSIFLVSVKTSDKVKNKTSFWLTLLPVGVFFSGGFVDATINYSNYRFIDPQNEATYTILVFSVAALIGTIILIKKGKRLELKSIIGGLCLGVPNYLSLIFVFRALTAFNNNGALFYPVSNIGVILLSTLLAIILFGEKLTKINVYGLILSVIALILLSYQEIVDYLELF